MADPVTMMAVGSMAASAGGSIMGAVGSSYAGQAQANMYQYQAGISQLNAQIAKQNADYALHEGEYFAQQAGLKTQETVGRTMAIQAASGLDVNKGSGADVRSSERQLGEEDEAVQRSSAAKKAYGFEVEAVSDTASGQLEQMSASTAQTAGTIGAISSILGGASSVSSKWLDASRQGIPGFVS
jgi:hypothetical protein